ncbi:MAG: Hin recombinase [Bacillota bacterium]|nr:Hin recombinase [Bacillota bacterium]
MARPSKLSEKQWAEVEKRHLAGESMRSLASEFGISEAAIRKRVSTRTNEIKEVAAQLVEAEQRFLSLPVSSQISARTLADELKAISSNLASAASYGAATAHKLAKVAHIQANKLSELEEDTPNSDSLRGIAALTNLANQASNIGMGLIAANKEVLKNSPQEEFNPRSRSDFYETDS